MATRFNPATGKDMLVFDDASAKAWYWIVGGSTTQVYSAAAMGYVPVTDATYVVWCASGGTATAINTEADLNAVLLPYGIYVDLTAYAPIVQAALLAQGQTFNVAASGVNPAPILCDGTSATRADLALLALYGQANPTGSKTWVDNAGVVTVLTGAQCVTLATLAGDWVSDTYAALVALFGEIEAGSVTTMAQVDAYAWPTA